MRTALYPGTFDPVTNGHLDILRRACRLFDKVIIAVANNPAKEPFFTVDERLELLRENVSIIPNAQVVSFQGLVVDYAKEVKAVAIIRGLRAVSDFEFEFQMTQMNRDLDPTIETIFLMPGATYFFTSSTLMKQVAFFEVSRIAKFIPENVVRALERKFGHK